MNLAEKLKRIGYPGLFSNEEEPVHEALWRTPGVPRQLVALCMDRNAEDMPRFLAAEILFLHEKAFPSADQKEALSPLYARALALNFTQGANAWGLPGVFVGQAGEHLIGLRQEAVPHLLGLLDHTDRVYYAGSQEPTMANYYQYRIKDVAAFLLSRLCQVPLVFDPDPAKRDLAIRSLQESVGNKE